ncbi:MAG TPA: multifunctional CCA tRNA nucleotidyl transferase/2'3'-cyclic phosphodiesterase/2'nucleotidase/phosphatase, partial [Arenimonas sp.]|nr:multifunctional CCA tRNA nucleotidyl transferase/2'3'-cyclic phosphodiesterase/2'nucleotidase/phosphatase [Arenimonas sp.]
AARFLARFAPLGFRLADETAQLLRDISGSGELAHLVAERIWQELHKLLGEAQPSAGLRCLRDCGALAALLPEVDALYGVPQRPEFHPEIDTGLHTEMVCDQAAKRAAGDALIGFCALTHDLGKALTPSVELPRHVMHEQRGLAPLRALCDRLKVPSEYAAVAAIVCREHLNIHRLDELRPQTVHELITRCDGWRKPQRIAQLALACEADKRGRLGCEHEPYPQAATLQTMHAAALAIDASAAVAQGLQGEAVGHWLRDARIAAIAALRISR